MPQPILNPEDYGYSNQVQPPEVPAQPAVTVADPNSADELVKRFYATREKAPEVDQAKLDRLKRMGKINQVGQGINVLGDVLSTALGATVRKRQPDSTAPALYQAYQNTLDKYKAEKDAYNYRDFQKKLDDTRMGIGEARYKEQNAYRKQLHEDQMKATEAKNAQDWNKFVADHNLRVSQINETGRHNKVAEGIGWANANKLEKDQHPVNIQTSSGKTYSLSPEEVSRYSSEVLNNQKILKQKHPDWFYSVPAVDRYGSVIPGKFDTRLNPRIKPQDLARDYIENQENPPADYIQAGKDAAARVTAPTVYKSIFEAANSGQPGVNIPLRSDNPPVQQAKPVKQVTTDYSKLIF